MKRAAKYYVDLVSLIGLATLPYCFYRYISVTPAGGWAQEWPQMLCLVLICIVCRSTPIYINTHHAIDVSILSIITAVLLRGPYAAVVVYILSSLFTIEFDNVSGRYSHLFNTPLRKTLFNNANLMISILIPGFMLNWIGHVQGNVSLPWVIWPMLLFTATSFLLNSLILLTLFWLNGDTSPREALSIMRSLIPNVLAAMPLGLLTCYVFTQEGGYWVALITLLPLMLARHAWKLYLDAQNQQYRLIQAFVASMEAKDKYTEGHSRRVHHYAEMIAQGMHLRPAQIEIIRKAALLHDIGKIGIPDAILLKPNVLSDEEFASIQSHPRIGVNIVEQVGLPYAITEIILHHHERFDGNGYPDRLPASMLSLGAQILAVADAFDAMTSERPYRKAMPLDEALNRLKQDKNTQFNPDVVDCLIALSDKKAFLEVLAS